MPFKKLSRRTFLTASSALAFLHTPFARALPAQQSVNISDYNPHDWIASFKQAFSEGQTVVVPAGLICDNKMCIRDRMRRERLIRPTVRVCRPDKTRQRRIRQ